MNREKSMLKHALTDWLMIVFLCFFFSTALSLPAIAQPPKQPAEGAEKADKGGEDPEGNPPAASEKSWTRPLLE